MSCPATVQIHPSQFPEQVRAQLLDCLRTRRVNHKFHYDTVKQAVKWLALHQAYAPSSGNAGCLAIYDQCFDALRSRIPQRPVHLVGLGCGGGQKEVRLIKGLRETNHEVFYTPLDVSTPLVLIARNAALQLLPSSQCAPFVCDLPLADDLSAHLDRLLQLANDSPPAGASPARLFTFFGMIPNFESEVILPRLRRLLGPNDYVLFSANLAPGLDYTAGVQRVLPLYDNLLTREWLLMFLLDLGIDKNDGRVDFLIEEERNLQRIAAYFRFTQPREIQVDSERFAFQVGDSIRLFFSYRHTPSLVDSLLAEHKMVVVDQWIAPSEEEGVFLVAARS